jgi:hypothetical protein
MNGLRRRIERLERASGGGGGDPALDAVLRQLDPRRRAAAAKSLLREAHRAMFEGKFLPGVHLLDFAPDDLEQLLQWLVDRTHGHVVADNDVRVIGDAVAIVERTLRGIGHDPAPAREMLDAVTDWPPTLPLEGMDAVRATAEGCS